MPEILSSTVFHLVFTKYFHQITEWFFSLPPSFMVFFRDVHHKSTVSRDVARSPLPAPLVTVLPPAICSVWWCGGCSFTKPVFVHIFYHLESWFFTFLCLLYLLCWQITIGSLKTMVGKSHLLKHEHPFVIYSLGKTSFTKKSCTPRNSQQPLRIWWVN
jgi:hypothetical protein